MVQACLPGLGGRRSEAGHCFHLLFCHTWPRGETRREGHSGLYYHIPSSHPSHAYVEKLVFLTCRLIFCLQFFRKGGKEEKRKEVERKRGKKEKRKKGKMEKLKREKKGSSKGVEEERCKKNISRWLNPRWPPKKFRTQIFWYTQKKLWTQIFFGLKLCSDPIFFPDPNFFRTQIFFRTQFNLDVRVSFFSIM